MEVIILQKIQPRPGLYFFDRAEKKYFDTELKIVYNIMMCVFKYITIFW